MDQLQCFECGMITRDVAMIKKRMNTVHNIKVETESLTRKLMCALCIFTFRDLKDLKHHLINVHNKE